MKVLHVTNLYPYDDFETYGIFVKEQIQSLGNPKFQDVFFINAKRNGMKEYYSTIFKLKKIINNYDIVHCHHQFSTIPVFFANRKAKIITSILGDIKKRNIINKIAYLFAKNISEKIIFKNNIPTTNDKYILLPNGVDLDKFKEKDKNQCKSKLNLNKENIHVLFVSNGHLSNPIKRHDKFIKIINLLNDNINTKRFVPLYLSNVKREEVEIYFNAADFMILTSDHEGSPNAVKEAMACNLPIVSTSVGDVANLLGNVKNSFVSQSGSVDDLIKLAIKIDYTKRSSGRIKLIELGLDADSIALKLKNVYQDIYDN